MAEELAMMAIMARWKAHPDCAKYGVTPGMTLDEFRALPMPVDPSQMRDEQFQRSLIPGVLSLVWFLRENPDAHLHLGPGLFVDTIGEGESTARVAMVCLGEVPKLMPDGKTNYVMTTMGALDPYSQPLTLDEFLACGTEDRSAAPFVGFRAGVNGGPLVPFAPTAGRPMGRCPDFERDAVWSPGTLQRCWPIVYNALATELGLPLMALSPKTMGELHSRPKVCLGPDPVLVPVDSLLDSVNSMRAARGLPRARPSADILGKGLSMFAPLIGVCSPWEGFSRQFRDAGFDCVDLVQGKFLDARLPCMVAMDINALCDPSTAVLASMQLGCLLERTRQCFGVGGKGVQHVAAGGPRGRAFVVIVDPAHGMHNTSTRVHSSLQCLQEVEVACVRVANTVEEAAAFLLKCV